MERLLLKSLREMSVIGTASIRMLPSGSASLNKAAISDDFPAPVLPTTPTWNNSEKRTWIFVLVAETTNVLEVIATSLHNKQSLNDQEAIVEARAKTNK